MQRRSNGLTAQNWDALGHLGDSAMAAGVLETLERAGVAAYVEQPASGDAVAFVPVVFVDANHVLLARAITMRDFPGSIEYRADLGEAPAQDRPEASDGPTTSGGSAGRLPAATGEIAFDVDAAFRDIVAGFDREVEQPVAPWPVSEDSEETPSHKPGPSARLIRRAQPLDPDLAQAGAADAEDHAAEMGTFTGSGSAEGSEPDGDHFVPPEPPAIPRGEAIDRFAWLGVIGGPIALLLFAFVDFGLGPILQYAAGFGFIGGCLTLLVRMGDRPSRADDWDDGAVV